ncbi:unnamed protein product [Thlaspi arvense]|uniref:Uncharacterized protein n=1 Tax=Thlaspi arvense TaxID=13288 RepID=A0AAU9RE02_THLAR|nr:unnamed protein product [Thlaspi arvense]
MNIFSGGQNSKSQNGAAQAVKIQIAASVNDRRSARSACKKKEFLSSSSTLLPAILQERERSVTDHINIVNQKQKQTEEEYSRKVQELQAELASSIETQEALERKVSYIQNDYSLLENKQNELKTTIQNLLQSRESFLNSYQESFCEMKCSIEARDRKIGILHQKISSHLALFDSIEKEASNPNAFTASRKALIIENQHFRRENRISGSRIAEQGE